MVAAVTSAGCGNERAFPNTPPLLTASEHGWADYSKENNSSYHSSSSSSSSTPQRFPSPIQKSSKSVDRPRTTTRSLAVSFQGESFVFQTSKNKPSSQKPNLPSRKPIAPFTGVENSARVRVSNSLTKSLNCSVDRDNHPVLLTVRLLLDEANSNIADPNPSSDSESNAKTRVKARGICVPARFRQENGCPRKHVETPQKVFNGKQQQAVLNIQLPSPKSVRDGLYGPKFCSPRHDGGSRIRRNIMESYDNDHVGNAPSIISFASEVRRAKKGESRIEDAHMLRLLHNRYLQWRYINARAENAFATHLTNAQNNLYDAWIAISELHESIMDKQIKLEVQRQNLKLDSMLKEQVCYLDEWSTLDHDHESSLRGVIEALKASTLRLPVIGGAKMDIHEVKDAISSTVGVMQAMTDSIHSLLSKVEGISSLASELAKAAAYERALLDQSRDLLSVVEALHMEQCSVQGYIIQLARKTSLMQLQ